MFSILLDIYLGIESLGHMVTWTFNLLRNCQTDFQRICTVSRSHQQCATCRKKMPSKPLQGSWKRRCPEESPTRGPRCTVYLHSILFTRNMCPDLLEGVNPAFKSLILRIYIALQSPECSQAGFLVCTGILFLLFLLITV